MKYTSGSNYKLFLPKNVFQEKYAKDNTEEPNTGDHYANIALNTTGLIVENVICHPLIVLRRQCQVGGGDGVTLKTHLTPFSLIPVAIHLYQWQGLSAFYKGLSSTLTVKGLQLAAEDATTKFTPWPKVNFTLSIEKLANITKIS